MPAALAAVEGTIDILRETHTRADDDDDADATPAGDMTSSHQDAHFFRAQSTSSTSSCHPLSPSSSTPESVVASSSAASARTANTKSTTTISRDQEPRIEKQLRPPMPQPAEDKQAMQQKIDSLSSDALRREAERDAAGRAARVPANIASLHLSQVPSVPPIASPPTPLSVADSAYSAGSGGSQLPSFPPSPIESIGFSPLQQYQIMQHHLQMQKQQQQHHHRVSPPQQYQSLSHNALLASAQQTHQPLSVSSPTNPQRQSPLLHLHPLPSTAPTPTHQHIHVEPYQLTSTRTYIGNLAFSTGFGAELGVMCRVEIISYPSGRSKGCAIVEFDTVEDAARAINELSGREIGGRKVFIREDRENKGFASNERRSFTPASSPAMHTGGALPSFGLLAAAVAASQQQQQQQQQQQYLTQLQQSQIAAVMQAQQQAAVQSVYHSLQQQLAATQALANYQSQQHQSHQQHHSPQHMSTSYFNFSAQPQPQQPHTVSPMHTMQTQVAAVSPVMQTHSLYSPQMRNTMPMYNQPLLIHPILPPPRIPAEPGCQIYVSNLPWRVTWQELRDLCSNYGVVLRAEVALDRLTCQSKGFGTVRFEKAAHAANAIANLHDLDYGGRKIIARIDEYAT